MRFPKIIVLGASTGGPKAVHTILSGFPADLPSVVFVVQHMPQGFTEVLAKRLMQSTGLPVSEARHGEEAKPGCVYVAKSGFHLLLTRKSGLRMELCPEPVQSIHRPSIDVFLSSVASLPEACDTRAVLLTGMGSDGARGLLELRLRGGLTAAEAEEDCVVFGMPKAAIALSAVDVVLPLADIADWLLGLSANKVE